MKKKWYFMCRFELRGERNNCSSSSSNKQQEETNIKISFKVVWINFVKHKKFIKTGAHKHAQQQQHWNENDKQELIACRSQFMLKAPKLQKYAAGVPQLHGWYLGAGRCTCTQSSLHVGWAEVPNCSNYCWTMETVDNLWLLHSMNTRSSLKIPILNGFQY